MLISGEIVTEGRGLIEVQWDSERANSMRVECPAGFSWAASDFRSAAIAFAILASVLESDRPGEQLRTVFAHLPDVANVITARVTAGTPAT